ncbi:hypothetical protein H6785_01835 [Candidatus Nomurabacteria bacterium]|nr:hypothetical protein [Candidatus Kaiserbacteria bacterium]MCB9815297.1 hypothetical protein [Candidatus Nomurabacteria bacterium]
MKKISFLTSGAILSVMPMLALAEFNPNGGKFGTLLGNILEFTNTVIIPFIIGIGFLVFVWGMFRYFIAGGANDEAKEKGKSLMIWATLGFVLIIVFWGVINLLSSSTGLGGKEVQNIPKINADIPVAPST